MMGANIGTAVQVTRTEHTSSDLRALAMVVEAPPRAEAAACSGKDRQTLSG